MHWEPLRVPDSAAWADVIADAEKEDQTGEHYDADDLAEELEDPQLDLATATVGGWDGDTLAAVGVLRTAGSAVPVHRVYFDGVVRPAYRRQGVGGELLAWAIARTPAVAEARHPGAAVELQADISDTNAGKQALFTREGFTAQRYFFSMRRPLTGDLPDAAVPAGYRIERFDLAVHDEPARLVRNAAFTDHWGSSEQTPETWKQWFTGTRVFRPDLSYVAVADGDLSDQPAAILLTAYFGADTVATGRSEAWISTIGTLREHRRHGLGAALLNTALRQAQQDGFAQAGLGVDAASPTGALGLYQAAGFTVQHRQARYGRAL